MHEEPMLLPDDSGPRAHRSVWEGRATLARVRGDVRSEREACRWLASQLLGTDGDIDFGLKYARRALELGEEDDWPIQVSAWLERVGQHELAAEVLAPSVNEAATAQEAARLLLRMARMQTRAGAHSLAMKNLLEAATVWPTYADALEQAGELAAAQGISDAVMMFLEAADRHELNGNQPRAFECRRKAFEVDPSHPQACHALAETLDQSERREAADEVRRLHARVSTEDVALATHLMRLSRALEDGDIPRALVSIIDGRLETDIRESCRQKVEDALAQAGLHDALAARWQWEASQKKGRERTQVLLALASLFLGRLACPERAVDSWIDAVEADPCSREARTALRTHARALHDQTALAEALIRVVRSHSDQAVVIDCLQELAPFAEERLADPALAHWAYAELVKRGVSNERIEEASNRLGLRVRLQDSALADAKRIIEEGDEHVKTDAWRRIAAVLRGRPDDVEEYLDVLTQLIRTGQGERRYWVDFERAAVRLGRFELLERVTRECLDQGVSPSDIEFLRSNLIERAWIRGDVRAVLQDALALAQDLPGTRGAHVHAWLASTLLGENESRAFALESLSQSMVASIRARLLALSAEIRLELGQLDQAMSLTSQAQKTDDSAPKVLKMVASIHTQQPQDGFSRIAEKLAAVHLPDHHLHASLISTLSDRGDHDLAHAWARRWLEVRPWDFDLLEILLHTATMASSTDALVAALVRITVCPLPLSRIESLLCHGLEKLEQRDGPRAVVVAGDLCDLYGVVSPLLRDRILHLAVEHDQPGLEAMVLERWMADPTSQSPETWLRLSTIHRRLGQGESAARSLLRAARTHANPQNILAVLQDLEPVDSGDAALFVLEARAIALQNSIKTPEDGSHAKVENDLLRLEKEAWLSLGSARWHRADNVISAMEAWIEAFGNDAMAFARLSESMANRMDAELVSDAFRDFAFYSENVSKSVSAFVIAAARSHALGRFESSIELALHALEKDPRRLDALVVVERASEKAARPDAMDHAHRLAAAGAKGRFGRRAAHLRAAMTLEARDFPEFAIVHAMAAFEADPVEGSALHTMLRLAERLGSSDVVDTLCRVAEASTDLSAQAHWWMMAARVASSLPHEARRSLDLSLRVLLAIPSVEVIELMERVLDSIAASEPEDVPIFEMRLSRARKALETKLEGPVGGRIAIAATQLAARVFRSPELALQWAWLALSCSGDIDEYEQIISYADLLAGAVEPSRDFIDEVLERFEGLRGTTGPALFAFATALANSLEDEPRQRALDRQQQEQSQASEEDPFADLAEDLASESDRPLPSDEEEKRESDVPPKAQATLRPGVWAPGMPMLAMHEPDEQEDAPITQRGLGLNELARSSKGELTESGTFDSSSPIHEHERLMQAHTLFQSGDLEGAIGALEQYEPSEQERPQIEDLLRKLYVASGHSDKLAQLLDTIASRTEDTATKVQVLCEMGKLHVARGQLQAARDAWQLVTQLDTHHHEAWNELEKLAATQQDHEQHAHILRRRAESSSSPSEERELRLQLVNLLDQKLGRLDQAKAELDSFLEKYGADLTILRYRAQLAERLGGPITAAPFWVRIATVLPSRSDAVELLCQAAEAYFEAGFHTQADETLTLAGDVQSPRISSLIVKIERHRSLNPGRLGDALESLAGFKDSTDPSRSQLLLEAASHALTAGQVEVGSRRARAAAALAPTDAAVQLQVAFLMYRLEGLSNREHVVEMFDRLRTGADSLDPRQQDLHAFLTAEFLEVLEGPDRSLDYLQKRSHLMGRQGPLLALALADRLSMTGDLQAALPLFDLALQADDLSGVRTKAQVAFAAARTALRVGGSNQATPFIAILEAQPGAEPLVERLRKEMTEVIPNTDEVRRQFDRLARTTAGAERAKALRQLARLAAARGMKPSNAEAEGYYVEAIAAAAMDPELQRAIVSEREAFRSRLSPSMLPPAVAVQMVSFPSAPRVPSLQFPSPALTSDASRKQDSSPPKHASEPPPTVASEPSPVELSTLSPEQERNLFEKLAQGDMEAGDRLASNIAGDPKRTSDLVAVRRRQVVLQPHSLRYLELLRDAARLDRNHIHAAAIHHVICVLSGQTPSLPPPLQALDVEPARILAMVERGVYGVASEVLAEVWTNASHLFSKEPSVFGLTGLERVALSSPSPVARAYATAAPILGLARTPVFHRRTRDPMNLAIAPLSPMAVVVTGDVEDGPELDYRMAAMLLATTPANAMLFGFTEKEVRHLMKVLLATFGPPDSARGLVSEAAALAEELWRVLPGSVQRRFTELYREDTPFSYEDAWARALQATRRAGLFVAGNLAVTLRDVLFDPSNQKKVDVDSPDAYRILCRESVSAADLVRLATSTEFAEVRWREPRSRSSGTIRSQQG